MALQDWSPGREGNRDSPADAVPTDPSADSWFTPGGIPVSFHAEPLPAGPRTANSRDLWLHQEQARLSLLRGFDELLCLEGLHGVEHLPHQIETVRKVLRHFHGRVLLADEVGLGKTIEACLLLREYLLRGMARRVLILVPAPLVSQWHEELSGKFDLEFTIPPKSVAADRSGILAEARPRAGLAGIREVQEAAGDRGGSSLGPGHRRRGPPLQESGDAELATRQLAATAIHVPALRDARAEQPARTLQLAHAAGPGPPADRSRFQEAATSSAAIPATRSIANGSAHCWAKSWSATRGASCNSTCHRVTLRPCWPSPRRPKPNCIAS